MADFPTSAVTISELPMVTKLRPSDKTNIDQIDGSKSFNLGQLKSQTNFIYKIDCQTSETIIDLSTNLQNIEVVLIENLDKAPSDIIVSINNADVGKKIQIINKHFNQDNFYKVTFQFDNLYSFEWNDNSFSFFYQSQVNSFIFDGDIWHPLFEIPTVCTRMNFINSTMSKGFLNIMDFSDPAKKVLFTNIPMDDVDVSKIQGRFFRDGTINTTQEDTLQNITGAISTYSGDFKNPEGAFGVGSDKSEHSHTGGGSDYNSLDFDASRTARTSDETRPKNIQGYYILKAW